MTDTHKFLTRAEAADLIGVSISSIRNTFVKRGDLHEYLWTDAYPGQTYPGHGAIAKVYAYDEVIALRERRNGETWPVQQRVWRPVKTRKG